VQEFFPSFILCQLRNYHKKVFFKTLSRYYTQIETIEHNQHSIDTAMTTVLTKESSAMKQIRTTYQADQQVKYLHLEAEIEVLLQQLQNLKRKNQENQNLN
jgi:ribose 1,5-bisphosphokinase PhnN